MQDIVAATKLEGFKRGLVTFTENKAIKRLLVLSPASEEHASGNQLLESMDEKGAAAFRSCSWASPIGISFGLPRASCICQPSCLATADGPPINLSNPF